MPIAPSSCTYPASGETTARTTGATGSADSSEVPPCASIQRRQTASALPSATAASARRRPSVSSIPRSESESSLAQASSTSSVKSAGPCPRTVSSASRTSSALPTAAPSGWSMSVSRQTTSRPGLAAERDHRLGELARRLERLHERAVADLHVEHDRLRATRDLLRHDRGGDQRELVDGRRDVAQRVEQLVGRHEVACLPDDRDTDVPHLSDVLVEAQLGPVAGNRLELVERAAGVPQSAAAHLPERHAAGGHDRRHRQRRLVADTARRVLVDHLAAEAGAEIDRLPATDHRVRQDVRLTLGQSAEVDGHAERSHLVVGNLAARVAEDQLGQLVVGELLPVALALDELRRPDHVVATKIVLRPWTTNGSSTSSGTSPAGTETESR